MRWLQSKPFCFVLPLTHPKWSVNWLPGRWNTVHSSWKLSVLPTPAKTAQTSMLMLHWIDTINIRWILVMMYAHRHRELKSISKFAITFFLTYTGKKPSPSLFLFLLVVFTTNTCLVVVWYLHNKFLLSVAPRKIKYQHFCFWMNTMWPYEYLDFKKNYYFQISSFLYIITSENLSKMFRYDKV